MIDQRLLRTDLDALRQALSRRSPSLLEDLDRATELDRRLLTIARERDNIRSRVNSISKEVAYLRRDGGFEQAEVLQTESKQLGIAEKRLTLEHDAVQDDLREVLLEIPNLPHPDTPDGMSSTDNPVVVEPVGMPADPDGRPQVPHWETARRLGILDNERAAKISGSMFTMQRGVGATLARALCQFGLDRNADVHEEIRPPSLVTTATLTATGQLPKFADDAYAIERDDLWCVPTAEAPLTSLFNDDIVNDTDLPIRVMAYSPSFRREAGAAGRDTRGMLRAHEFDKVEILTFCMPEQAPALLDDMVDRASTAMADLGLPYRVVEICAGDLGQGHHRSFDVEVYAPGAGSWLEVSSISWFGDYQARRGNARFRRHDTAGTPVKGVEFLHTLNGSALAVPRVWAAIIENHLQDDGSVAIPPVLHPYLRGLTKIPS